MIRKTLLAAPLLLCVAGAAHAGTSPFVGEIETYGFSFCPSGWLPTNGALLPITGYNVLYQLLGTKYGGDGITTFALPNTKIIKTKNLQPLTQCIAYLGVYPSQN